MRQRAPEPTAGPPAWFAPERYEPLAHACRESPKEMESREIWLGALNRCWALKEWSAQDWAQKAEAIGESFPPADGSPPMFGPCNDLLPPPVMAFTRADIDEPWFDLFGPTILIRVSLAAPDAAIRDALQRELERARTAIPSTVKRPGPSATNSDFTRQMFGRWWGARAVQVAELDWWNARQAKRVPAAQLARWVFGEDAHPGRETRQILNSRIVLDRAIKCRDELAFSLRSGSEPST